jgi:hypothetical protein
LREAIPFNIRNNKPSSMLRGLCRLADIGGHLADLHRAFDGACLVLIAWPLKAPFVADARLPSQEFLVSISTIEACAVSTKNGTMPQSMESVLRPHDSTLSGQGSKVMSDKDAEIITPTG